MKKKYFFTIVSIVFSLSLIAQVNFAIPNKVVVPKPEPHPNINKSTSCIDVIAYPATKATDILLDTMEYATYIGAVGQIYNYSGNGLVHGINTYMTLDLDGISGNKDSIRMVISVRNLDGGKIPTTILGSDTVFVKDVGFSTQNLMFSSPIAVTDSFVVVIEVDTLHPSNPYYATNNYGDGAAEKLSVLAYQGTWYNLFIAYAGTWDVDMILNPIFEQNVTANYSVDVNPVCFGFPVTFTNTSTVNYNTMFNLLPPSYLFSIEGGVTNLDSNLTNTFANAQSYLTTLHVVSQGYTNTCEDFKDMMIHVTDSASSNFVYSELGGGVYQFTNASTHGTNCFWDFGDGDTSTTQHPTHTYLVGNIYSVCLTVLNDSTCAPSTYCQELSFTVGRKEIVSNNEVKIYPIPAKRFFTVELPSNFVNPEISLTDIVGKKIISIDNIQQNKVKVITDDLNSGVYFISVSSNGQKVFTKRIIVDK